MISTLPDMGKKKPVTPETQEALPETKKPARETTAVKVFTEMSKRIQFICNWRDITAAEYIEERLAQVLLADYLDAVEQAHEESKKLKQG